MERKSPQSTWWQVRTGSRRHAKGRQGAAGMQQEAMPSVAGCLPASKALLSHNAEAFEALWGAVFVDANYDFRKASVGLNGGFTSALGGRRKEPCCGGLLSTLVHGSGAPQVKELYAANFPVA